MSKILYDLDPSQLVLIADGTYLYCEKSENSDTQRRLYSGQKKCHLIKPFVIVQKMVLELAFTVLFLLLRMMPKFLK